MNKFSLLAAVVLLGLAWLGGPASAPGPVVVTIRPGASAASFIFDPPLVEVAPGTTVLWVNPTVVFHTVTVTLGTTGDSFNVFLEGMGECEDGWGTAAPCEYMHTFTRAGVVAYHCIPHAMTGMRGAVAVAG